MFAVQSPEDEAIEADDQPAVFVTERLHRHHAEQGEWLEAPRCTASQAAPILLAPLYKSEKERKGVSVALSIRELIRL